MAGKHVGPWTPLGKAMDEARRLYLAHDSGGALPFELPPARPDKPKAAKQLPGQLALALEAMPSGYVLGPDIGAPYVYDADEPAHDGG